MKKAAVVESKEEEDPILHQNWLFMKAKSGRSACKECGDSIDLDEHKLLNHRKHTKGVTPTGSSYHLACIDQEKVNAILKRYQDSWDKVPGHKILSEEEMKKLKKFVVEE